MGGSLLSPMVAIRPGERYAYWFGSKGEGARVQARLVWLDRGLNVLSWADSPVRAAGGAGGYGQLETAPEGAAYVRLQIRNATDADSTATLRVAEPGLTAEQVYVEPHPNAAQASLAFSFDWETAMGGAIHSKGAETHDLQAATEHGLAMREGADWLADLFRRHDQAQQAPLAQSNQHRWSDFWLVCV